MSTLLPTSVSSALTPGTYIYGLLHTPTSITTISSDDCIRHLDATTLSLLPDGLIQNAHRSVTCLEPISASAETYATAGRDGLVKFWDRRTGKSGMGIESPNNTPLSALACSPDGRAVVAGTELEKDGPGDAPVFVWDTRNPNVPVLLLPDSHTDTITTLSFHPSHPHILLSGSTDSLVNVFDTRKPDEEEALYQVINHSSAIHHAGFLNETDIYALGTDETLSFYQLQSEDDSVVEPAPKALGDVREGMGLEYVVKVMEVGGEACVVGGSHSSQYLDLIPLRRPTGDLPLNWAYDVGERVRLPGGHGEEIVRDVYSDAPSRTTYTGGEDGSVRAWKLADADEMDVSEGDGLQSKKAKKEKNRDKEERRKHKEKKKERFKPY
ncbi:WD40 repeat-like protein [Mytilinidion resinicola]|uniref:WD40 repeat-like protein n=1 Tax=Mytilinidion resinicola TaxID=574789 RepID=A0A6A6Z6U3_9PEZI|nr:WD40 repeat-like protein [Mytilinidion resinicola]KAF2816429.1 WD40 repeat-like protein [Mytilinidion resinicola]